MTGAARRGSGSVDECETVRFDLRPHHAIRGLTGLWIVLALLTWPDIDCWCIAALCAGAGWYTRMRRICWPADIQEFLARRGWALPRAVPTVVDATPPIPFRPMTIAELYSGAVKIVLRNWPTLIGVPAVIHTGFAVGLVAILFSAGKVMGSPQLVDLILGRDGELRLGAVALTLGVFLGYCAVLFPGDGLLISLGAQAAEKALRGEEIRFNEVFSRATERKLAVSRLIIAYYLIGAGTLLIQVVAVFTDFYAALLPIVLVCAVVSVVVGILLSMAPVILVLEHRNVPESFRRSIELCKPAVSRVLAINLVWIVGLAPLVVLCKISWVVAVLASPVVCGVVRCAQMLAYADLRMRQDNYALELHTDWTRNRG
jgi:hypothetical protein